MRARSQIVVTSARHAVSGTRTAWPVRRRGAGSGSGGAVGVFASARPGPGRAGPAYFTSARITNRSPTTSGRTSQVRPVTPM